MGNVVEQIMHPHLEEAIEKLEAAHQVEIRQLEDRMQGQIDDLQDRVNNAESSAETQREEIDRLIPRDKKTGKKIPVTLDQFKTSIESVRLSGYQNDWDVISYVADILEFVKPNVEVVEREVIVKEIPSQLLSDLKSIAGFAGKWIE